MEKEKKIIAKTLSFRFIATFVTIGIVWGFTGKLALAAGAGILDTLVKLVLYYGHEEIWNRVKWGEE